MRRDGGSVFPAHANTGDPLSVNEHARALISMMARSTTLQSKAGYIDARPFTTSSTNPLATHGRTIHARPDHTSGSKRRFDDVRLGSAPTLEVDIHREPAKVPKWRFARASI